MALTKKKKNWWRRTSNFNHDSHTPWQQGDRHRNDCQSRAARRTRGIGKFRCLTEFLAGNQNNYTPFHPAIFQFSLLFLIFLLRAHFSLFSLSSLCPSSWHSNPPIPSISAHFLSLFSPYIPIFACSSSRQERPCCTHGYLYIVCACGQERPCVASPRVRKSGA